VDNKEALYLESIRRNYGELIDKGIDRLKENTQLTDFRPGSMARSILQVYYDDIENLYDELYRDAERSYVSTSYGRFLEELGHLVNCHRNNNQSDDNYKAKIYHNPQLKAKGNKKAVIEACRNVDGVNDIEVNEYPRGIGSFDIFVISEDPDTSEEVLEKVQAKIDEVKSSGIDGKAIRPSLVYIDLYIRYSFYDTVGTTTIREIQDQAEDTIREYIINKETGPTLIINNLIKQLMSVSPSSIQDVRITDMYIDGRQTLINNKDFEWDQRLVPNKISIR